AFLYYKNMRHLLLTLLLLFATSAAQGANPAPVCRHVPSSNSFNNNTAATNASRLISFDFFFPFYIPPGSAIGIFVTSVNRTYWVASATDNTRLDIYTKVDNSGANL